METPQSHTVCGVSFKDMKQTKKMSLLEAKINAVVGVVVSWSFTFWGLPYLGLTPSAGQATIVTACFFFLSVVRAYAIRRLFNELQT